MGVISRGFKNAFRNTIRTVSITFILGLSIAMALIMLLAMKTVQSKINSVKSSIGNTITVSPAGVRGFEGGGELLTEQNASDIANISHVSSVVKTLSDRLESTNTSLVSSIEPGSFGNRTRGTDTNANMGSSSANISAPKNFTMPVTITGTNNLDSLGSLGVSQLNLTSGSKFDASTTDNVAIVGAELSTKNNLSVGSTFTAYAKDVTVVGIFDSGNKFTNGGVIMPLKAIQTLSSQTDQVNSIVVQTDSIDTISTVTADIKSKLGDKVDVVSSQDSAKSAVTPLENIKTISFYSLIGSLAAGSIIIFLTMIMIVRERRREIGVLKAIGSSNVKIVSQFTVESLVLTLMSSVLGIVLGFIFSNPVLKVLVNNSQTTSTSTKAVMGAGGPVGGMGGRAFERIGGGIENAQNTLNNIHAVVGWDIILYGLLAAFAIAIIGSAIPAFFISKVRPAEVMRQE